MHIRCILLGILYFLFLLCEWHMSSELRPYESQSVVMSYPVYEIYLNESIISWSSINIRLKTVKCLKCFCIFNLAATTARSRRSVCAFNKCLIYGPISPTSGSKLKKALYGSKRLEQEIFFSERLFNDFKNVLFLKAQGNPLMGTGWQRLLGNYFELPSKNR